MTNQVAVSARMLWPWSLFLSLIVSVGCAPPPDELNLSRQQTKATAIQCVRRGMIYPDIPEIRVQALEAAGDALDYEDIRGDVLSALADEHESARFAACMVIGKHRDKRAEPRLREMAADPNRSVRVAAYFALERVGVRTYRQAWRDALREDADPLVRRNAALALGRLEDPNVVPLLEIALIKDGDDGVRLQATEALALLGNGDAVRHFMREAFGGVGFRQPFALLTLGHIPDDSVIPTLRKRLREAEYIEAQLAAARSLGMHGNDDGFELAIASLKWSDVKNDLPDDPPALQIRRVRQMAAMALGDIGRPDALPQLVRTMRGDEDPSVQLAAAAAILQILERLPPELPDEARPTTE